MLSQISGFKSNETWESIEMEWHCPDSFAFYPGYIVPSLLGTLDNQFSSAVYFRNKVKMIIFYKIQYLINFQNSN